FADFSAIFFILSFLSKTVYHSSQIVPINDYYTKFSSSPVLKQRISRNILSLFFETLCKQFKGFSSFLLIVNRTIYHDFINSSSLSYKFHDLFINSFFGSRKSIL